MNSMKKQPIPATHREHSHGQGSSMNIPKRNYKLLVDPQLKKGQEKLTRFNGESYSCVNHGQRPVVVRDPRAHTTRLWARKEQVDLPVPRYKVDEWYIGAVPPREVTFSKLNDNITKQFMEQMCGKYGKLERVRVYHHPKTDKHMGLAKVVFSSIKSAAICIERLHQTSIMGNIINAELDSKGELLKRLFNKIVKGELMADTMPDVIKHTQEKPQPRPNKIHKQRRKSSTDDPRRKSTDSLGRQSSTDFHSSMSGPKTPPVEASPINKIHHPQSQISRSQETDINQDSSFPPQNHPHRLDDNLTSAIYVPPHQLEDNHERGLPPHLHGVTNIKDFPKPHSLDSEHGSHPGSASIMSDQVSPFCHNQFSDVVEENKGFIDPMMMEKQAVMHAAREPEHKPKPPLWTKDLENRIESLISEQNQKYNLDNPKVAEPVKMERRRSSASETKELNYFTKLSIKKERSPQDLEDGECSGEDQPDEEASSPESTVIIKEEIISVKTEVKTIPEPHLEKPPSPLPPREFSEKLRPRFSRSPSPTFRFPASHSPPRIPDRPGIDHPAFNEQRRYPPPPDDYFHSRRQGSFSHERFRHPSPGRPPHDFGDRRFHHEMFDSRSRSPTFDHRRRPVSPFDNHHRHSRSPGYERRHHHPHSPGRGRPPSPGRGRPPSPGRGRPPSPGRGRPLSPGYLRHHDLPPGHPDFGRRRTPSPGFDHRRRSISPPRRFQGPILRREFDCSPRRERMYFSPHDIDRHRRDLSPRYSEHDRHRKRSPGLRHDHHRPINIPPSPESRKMREHRELPPEFRERWSRQLSSSPPPQGRPRFPADSGHIPHPNPGHILRRSRSSSPETLNSTPPRIRSPVRMHPDQKPYSPGDLPLDDSTNTDGHDPNAVDLKAARRTQRESSDHDVPVISLDERLREITGEPPPEPDSPPESSNEVEEEEDKPKEVSPTASEDMEISSGGGGSEHGDQPPPVKQHPYADMPFRNGPGPFRPLYPGPPGQMWRFGGPRGGPDMWNGYNPRFPMNQQRPMWRGPLGERPRYPPHLHGGFPQPLHNQNHPEPSFNNQMLPPPPPGWNNRPWVQGQQHPPLDPMFVPGVQEAQQNEESEEHDSNKVLGDCVLNLISQHLKETIRKDLNKKVIETMAFKVYESWWDEQHALKNPKPVSGPKPSVNNTNPPIKTEPNIEVQAKITEINNKPVTQAGKLPALLNTFDPLNWAKGSLEMDGFRIGLGFRSAISKMPSFRVKKRTPSPTPILEKKPKLDDNYRKSKDKENQAEATRKRIWLDSEGEEEDDSEQESSEEDEEDQKDLAKTRAVLTVEEVFSSSPSSSEDEATDDEDETDEESDDEQEEEAIEHLPVKKGEVVSSNKRSLDEIEDHLEPPKKKLRTVCDERDDEKEQSSVEKLDDAVAQAALSLSELQSRALSGSPLLSPSAPAGTDLTQESLRHVHPKKRYRLLSKDETRNLDLIAEVSNKLRSDDEVSSMSDKEKAALEILRDMKSTPERIGSSANRFSESSDTGEPLRSSVSSRQLSEGAFAQPTSSLVSRHSSLDARLPSTPGSAIFADTKQSGEEELEAVEALLSIKQSQPPIPPLSPPTAALLKKKSSKKRKGSENQEPHEGDMLKVSQHLTQKDREVMSAIAEEHNYFALSPKDREDADAADPRLLQILEEHSYSCPPSQAPETTAQRSRRYEREKDSLFESGFLKIDGDLSSASAAERVKLRRESKTEKKTKPKTTKGRDVYADDRRKPSYHRHRVRSEMEEMVILYLMWTTGLDVEDMRFLRLEYEDLLTEHNVPKWANDTHWTPHPITNIPDPDAGSASSSPSKRNRKRRNKKKNDLSELKAHKSGCARSEGYYKVADKTKLIQRRLMYRHADNTNTGGGYGNAATSSTTTSGVATEKSREARHMMRRIAFEFGSDASDLLKYNQLMYRKKSVKFKRSQIHGWGLFAEETIGADEMVIEYVGQLVRSLVADRREVDYTKRGIGSSYLFRIDSDHIIDATKCGNYARFMNHSCDPSCYAKVITVDGAKKIVIYSKNVIRPSDEITYDYKFPIEDVKIPCFCGAINCRGTLN